MKLKEFTQDSNLVLEARVLFNSPFWKTIEQVLHAEHPARFDGPMEWTTDQRAIWQAKTSGFEKVQNIFSAMQVESKPQQEVLGETWSEEVD